MTQSATEMPGSEEEWLEALNGPEPDLDEDAATSEEPGDPPPAEEEGDDPVPPEGDATAEQEGPTDDATQPDTEDEGEQPAEGEPEAEPDAEAVATTAEVQEPDQAADGSEEELRWEPWTARADGSDLDIPDAQVSERGLFVPRESLPKLQSYLADRSAWERTRNRLEAELRRKSGAEAEAETIVAFYQDLLSRPEDEQWQWFSELSSNAPKLLAEAKAAREKARADSYEQRDREAQQAEFDREFERWAPAKIDEIVGKAVTTLDEYRGLGLDAEAVSAAVKRRGNDRLFYRNEGEEPIEYHGKTYAPGDVFPNFEEIVEAIAVEARVARAQREARAATEAAKARNQSKVPGKRKRAAPVVTSTGAPAPGDREAKEPQSLEDWEASLRDDEI